MRPAAEQQGEQLGRRALLRSDPATKHKRNDLKPSPKPSPSTSPSPRPTPKPSPSPVVLKSPPAKPGAPKPKSPSPAPVVPAPTGALVWSGALSLSEQLGRFAPYVKYTSNAHRAVVADPTGSSSLPVLKTWYPKVRWAQPGRRRGAERI